MKALYLTADVLLVTSLHEGFCVPLVEAMGLRLPVVAVPTAAVPYTGGDAARYADADPAAIAERIREVLADPAEREGQVTRGLGTVRVAVHQRRDRGAVPGAVRRADGDA